MKLSCKLTIGVLQCVLGVLFQKGNIMKKYKCPTCDYIYDPSLGDPEAGIPAGTAFEDLPEDWVCPDCGEPKEEFEAIEE